MEEKLIIFDVDNTLIMYENDLEFFDGILLEALQIHNIPPPDQKERVTLWGTGHNYPNILNKWGITDILSFWKTFDKIDTEKRIKMVKEGKITLNEEVIEVLERLSMRGFKIAALSNSNQPITDFFLDYYGISKYFSWIQGLTPDKDPYECKPEINGFYRLFSNLEFQNSSKNIVYMVGDSFTDVLAAKRVGIHGILFDPKSNKINKLMNELKENEYTRIRSIKELLNIPPPSNNFGYWEQDDQNLPVFIYTADQFNNANCSTFTTYGKSLDHFHQIGNTRWSATAHNGGFVQILDPSQGFLWLTYRGMSNDLSLGGGIVYLEKDGKIYSDLYTADNPKNPISRNNFKRVFGTNYFIKESKFEVDHQNIEISNKISIPPDDQKVLISNIIVKNTDTERSEPVSFKLYNYWGVNFYYSSKSSIVTWGNRKKYGTTKILNLAGNIIRYIQKLTGTDTDSSRLRWANQVKYNPLIFTSNGKQVIGFQGSHKKIKQNPNQEENLQYPSSYPQYLDTFYMCSMGTTPDYYSFERLSPSSITCKINSLIEDLSNNKYIKKPGLTFGYEIVLKPGDSKEFCFLIGYESQEKIKEAISKVKKDMEDKAKKEKGNEYQKKLISLEIPGEFWLKREILWHSSYILGSIYRDELYKLHKIPQGSTYAIGHGFDGSIRDYALFLPSLIYLNPDLAKEYLIYMLSLMKSDGSLPYGIYGLDKPIPLVHSKASDLYLFILWAISEYIYTTRNFEFLQFSIKYYQENPNIRQEEGNVVERIRKAIEFIFSKNIGLGPNNLLKINDGDWSDGITLLAKNRKNFVKNGESVFNSAMALYVLPRIQPIIKEHLPELSKVVQNNISSLNVSVQNSWNGNWFNRAYNGKNEPLGAEHLFLEHIPWILLSHNIDGEKIDKLLGNIHKMLEKLSPIGQLIVYPPLSSNLNLFPKGWDVNGGIWHAMNSLLTWAYSEYNQVKAWNSLLKNSMHQHEKVYPNIWYGIWTGPDSYNAYYADRPGEAFFHLPTPMCDYPAFNMNLHCCYLMSAIKMIGFSADFEGLSIKLSFDKPLDLHSPLFDLKIDEHTIKFAFKRGNQIGGQKTIAIKFNGNNIEKWQIKKIKGAVIHSKLIKNESLKINLEKISEFGFLILLLIQIKDENG